MVDTRSCARKVRRSLLQRDLMGGIPQMGLIGLFVMSVMFVYLFKMYFMIIPIVVLYFVMRHFTKIDPWMIEAFTDNLQQKDVYIP